MASDGYQVRGCDYPWGVVEVNNEEHCNFVMGFAWQTVLGIHSGVSDSQARRHPGPNEMMGSAR